MTRLGIVTGMQFEADILAAELAKSAGADIKVVCAGPGYRPARRAAEALMDDGADALLSFGIAGSLLEEARPGTLLLADQVIHWSDAINVDAAWMGRLREGIAGQKFPSRHGNLAHSDPPAATPSDKRFLHIQTRALGVDMESFGVAEIARDRGARFLALRTVADAHNRMVPVSAIEAMNNDGTVSAVRALTVLSLHPWEIGDMIRLGLNTAAAKRTLSDLARLGVPRLFFM